MTDPVEAALVHLSKLCAQGVDSVPYPITINFHPDLAVDGVTVIECIARYGTYRCQFETGTSSGGLTAYRGGDRWSWESRIFGAAYDNAHPSLRPKYGALNYRLDSTGGSRRFGSSHLRLLPHVRNRTSFCYPDSHLQPSNFAIGSANLLIAMADANELGLDPWLDNYVEAHVHGPLSINADVDAIVLDPSFQDTSIERAALSLGCRLEWHGGFQLSLDRLGDCEAFRGPVAARAIMQIAKCGAVTPAVLWRARDHFVDYQTAKWVWHCMARYGHA